MLKNIAIVVLALFAIIGAQKYIVAVKEKVGLLDSLNKVKQQAMVLEQAKNNLSQELKMAKADNEKIASRNASLKEYLKAAHQRIIKSFQAQKKINELNTYVSLLKSENAELAEKNTRYFQENENLKARLSSGKELKKALKELKKQAYKVTGEIMQKTDEQETIVGNRGYVIKDGQINNPPKVKIEVVPAGTK